MNTEDGYQNLWHGEQDGVQGDGGWIQHPVGDGDAALKHMCQV